MATGQWGVVLRHVQRLFHGESVAGLSEGQLLERFASTRDEMAFGAILARHGPMVLGVCRGFLDDPHDVDDAFQATFLVLVKKAGALRETELLGQWLYGVARRVALRARSNGSRRKARERPEAEAIEAPRVSLDAELRELQGLIREEVDRLSGNDRMAVVLCYLEGLTHEEAADRLGWPVGTVKGRLSRARDKLRERLTRRGVALPAAAIGSTLAGGASAAVPIELVRSTTLAATRLASGQTLTAGIVSAQAITLMEGVIGTMYAAKLKLGAMALVATCAVAVPGVLAFQGQGPDDRSQSAPATKKATTNPPMPGKAFEKVGRPQPDTASDDQGRLSEQALVLAKRAILAPPAPGMASQGSRASGQFYAWSRRIADAKANSQDRMAAIQAHRDRMRDHVALVDELIKGEASGLTEIDLLEAKYQLIEADRWLRDGRMDDLARPASPELGGGFGVGGSTGPVGKATLRETQADEARDAKPKSQELSPRVAKEKDDDERRNDAINAKLDEKVLMNFPKGVSVEDLKRYVAQATQDEAGGFPTGVPIYLEPPEPVEGEQDKRNKVMVIDLEGIPLRTTLRLALRQAGLDYRVRGGLLLIAHLNSPLLLNPGSQLGPMGGMGGIGGGFR